MDSVFYNFKVYFVCNFICKYLHHTGYLFMQKSFCENSGKKNSKHKEKCKTTKDLLMENPVVFCRFSTTSSKIQD